MHLENGLEDHSVEMICSRSHSWQTDLALAPIFNPESSPVVVIFIGQMYSININELAIVHVFCKDTWWLKAHRIILIFCFANLTYIFVIGVLLVLSAQNSDPNCS